MSFRIIAVDDGEGMISSAMPTKEQALNFARDLRRDGLAVLRIVNPAGSVVVDTEEIIKWCTHEKQATA